MLTRMDTPRTRSAHAPDEGDAPASPHTLAPPLRFVRGGKVQALGNVPPTRTLLELLRDDLGHTGTKEGCRSGDCGACTVVVAEPDHSGGLSYRAVNSCIKLAHSINGQALWTVEDLGTDPLIRPAAVPCATPAQAATPRRVHPIQQALVTHHASQCGFCTPGFVMSLFALYQSRAGAATHAAPLDPAVAPGVSRADALAALSGNLCRCTGYRPILDAAQTMLHAPLHTVNGPEVISLIEQTNKQIQALDGYFVQISSPSNYRQPATLNALLQARHHAPHAQLVAGCTDVGLWITKGQQTPTQVLDLTRTAELRAVQHSAQGLEIGAAVSLTDAFAALVATRPTLAAFAERFAGLPVRNAGTLGGNVANGSPIGDSMPLLMALGAQVRLMRWDETTQQPVARELPLEALYLGYRQTALTPTEVLTHILVPPPQAAWQPPEHPSATATAEAPVQGQWLRVYKISKRFEDDISAVCLGLQLTLDHGTVAAARIGVGGVAATPVRAHQTEAALTGQPWHADTVARAAAVLSAEFAPLSDMRASAAYRRQVLGGLLRRTWLESQGHHTINLEHASREHLVGARA